MDMPRSKIYGAHTMPNGRRLKAYFPCSVTNAVCTKRDTLCVPQPSLLALLWWFQHCFAEFFSVRGWDKRAFYAVIIGQIPFPAHLPRHLLFKGCMARAITDEGKNIKGRSALASSPGRYFCFLETGCETVLCHGVWHICVGQTIQSCDTVGISCTSGTFFGFVQYLGELRVIGSTDVTEVPPLTEEPCSEVMDEGSFLAKIFHVS